MIEQVPDKVPEAVVLTEDEEIRLTNGGLSDQGLVPGLMGEFC
jgi:hypothetical protein